MSAVTALAVVDRNAGDLVALRDSFEIFIAGEALAATTRHNYLLTADAFIDWAAEGNAPMFAAELRRSHLAAFMVHIANVPTQYGKLPSKSTTATYYRRLQQWFRFMVDEGEMEASPLAHLKAPKARVTPPPVITADHITALIASCADDGFYGLRDEAIIRVMLDAGPRVSEVAGIDLADVNLKHLNITVLGKGDKVRPIPVGKKTARALDRYIRARSRHPRASHGELWLGYRRQRLSSGAISKMLERRCALAGIPPINAHKFRHTFAHLYRKGGGGEAHLMAICGWDSPAMARRYGASMMSEEALEAHAMISPGDMF